MQYEEKIIEFIFENNADSLFDWLASFPPLEQVDILKEFKEIIQELLLANNDTSQTDTLQELEKKIDEYQEAVLDEQVAGLKLDIATNDRDKAFAEMNKTVEAMREYVKECITTNAPNAEQMKELAQHVLKYETEAGIYDAKNWKWYEPNA